jgi:hypothetical protein
MKYTPPKVSTKVEIKYVEKSRVVKWNDKFFIVTDGYEKRGIPNTQIFFLSMNSIEEFASRIIVSLDDGCIYSPLLNTLVEVVE